MADEKDENGKPTGSPLPPKRKKRKPWVIVVDVISGIVVFCSCAVIVNVTYLNVNFNEPFFVNGMSMYPTLNKDGERLENGSYRPLTWDDRSNLVGDLVDFGYAKTGDKGDWRDSLSRYDVVVSFYPDDYDGEGLLLPGREAKIKRLIGMPGETLTFETVTRTPSAEGTGGLESVGGAEAVYVDAYSEDYNPAWGKTTILHEDGTTEILKPLYSEEDYPDLKGRKYPNAALPSNLQKKTWVLGENEYFLMGDNRGGVLYSRDSRDRGPVKEDMIVGKAYLITGKRKIVSSSEGLQAQFQLGSIYMPWDYKHLDIH